MGRRDNWWGYIIHPDFELAKLTQFLGALHTFFLHILESNLSLVTGDNVVLRVHRGRFSDFYRRTRTGGEC
jgi:hypothetical protein